MKAPRLPNMIISAALAGCAAAFVLAVYRGAAWGFAALWPYYLAALAGSVFLARVLAWPPAAKAKTALAIMTACVALYAAELLLSAQSRKAQKPRAVPATGWPDGGDRRAKIDVIQEYQRKGRRLIPSVPLDKWARHDGFAPPGERKHLFPLSGASKALTITENENGYWPIFVTDRYGFNNPDQVWTGAIDLVLIGDSFTHGWGVRPEENIAARLASTGRTVLNLGMPAAGPLIDLGLIKEYAAPVRPAVVLWMYYENDLWDLHLREKKCPSLLCYLQADYSQNLKARQMEIDRQIDRYVDDQLRLELATQRAEERPGKKLYRALTLHALRRAIRSAPWWPRPAEPCENLDPAENDLLQSILAEGQATARKCGSRLIFVFLPERNRLFTSEKDSEFQYKGKILDIVRSLNIPVIDVTEVFKRQPDIAAYFPPASVGHYNEKGYRLVADTIAAYLDRHGP